MIILDKPYISEFLTSTAIKNRIPILRSNTLNLHEELNLINEDEFKKQIDNSKNPKLYSNSENAINWISRNLNSTDIPKKIELFKNKVVFRDLLKPIFPDFFYKGIKFDELATLDITNFSKPFIIKPSVGFFSMGVYKVNSNEEWDSTVRSINNEMLLAKELYPKEVINSTDFIIEQNIPGKEFAIDAYFNEEGKPVILNVLEHIFPNEDDLTDRAYITSKEIIIKYHDIFEELLDKIGSMAELVNFPMHIELKISDDNNIIPIEVNPMRFTGWCLTDLAYFAYNINIYEYYLNGKKPDWNKILEGRDGLTYSMIIGTLPEGYTSAMIDGVDWDAFKNSFNKVLELRKVDYNEYPVFGFLFTETSDDNKQEIDKMLKSDLKEFFRLK